MNLGDAATVVGFAVQSVSPKLARDIPDDIDPDVFSLDRDEFAGETLAIADHLRLFGLLLPIAGRAAVRRRDRARPGPPRRGAARRRRRRRSRDAARGHAADPQGERDRRGGRRGRGHRPGGARRRLGADRRLPGRPGRLGPAAWAARCRAGRRRGRARPRRRRGPHAAPRAPARAARLDPRPRAARCGGPGAGHRNRARADARAPGRRHRRWRLPRLLRRHRAARPDRAARPARGRHRGRRAAGRSRSRAASAWLPWRRCSWSWSSSPVPRASRTARRPRSPPKGCNGSRELCDRPLNEVAFAGTHNSFSAADSPAGSSPTSATRSRASSEDGIRLFLIDPHWGVELPNGRVLTDFDEESRDRNKVAKAMPPEVLAAAERLVGRQLGGGRERRQPGRLALPHGLRAGRHAHGRLAQGDARLPRRQPGRGRDPVHRALRQAGRDRQAVRAGRARQVRRDPLDATSRCRRSASWSSRTSA